NVSVKSFMKSKQLFFVFFVTLCNVMLAEPPAEGLAIAADPDRQLECTMSLTTNGISTCASGLLIKLKNVNASEAYNFETYEQTCTVTVNQPDTPGPRRISKLSKRYTHHEPPKFSPARILPGESITWSVDFDEVI